MRSPNARESKVRFIAVDEGTCSQVGPHRLSDPIHTWLKAGFRMKLTSFNVSRVFFYLKETQGRHVGINMHPSCVNELHGSGG